MAGVEKRQIVLDTDISLGTPGAEIDDGAALIALLAVDSLAVQAITTVHGNIGPQLAMHNLQRLLHFLDRTAIPLGMGAAEPLAGDNHWFAEWRSGYGRTAPWPDIKPTSPASGLIIDTIRRNPGQITLLAIGPLTNLALAIEEAPDIIPLVESVVIMGGSFGSTGPEFNFRCDPQAAHLVLQAGWPIRMLGLEVTRQIFFSREDFAALPQSDQARALLRRQAPGWIDRVENEGWEQGGCALHDAVALLSLLDSTLFDWREASVAVDLTNSKTRGATRISSWAGNGKRVHVATGCHVQACYDQIWSLLSRQS